MTHRLHVERYSRFFQDIVAPAVMKRDGNKCIKCNSTKNLEISHNRYGEDITIKDLETLCRSCHKKKDHALGLFVKNYPESHKGDFNLDCDDCLSMKKPCGNCRRKNYDTKKEN